MQTYCYDIENVDENFSEEDIKKYILSLYINPKIPDHFDEDDVPFVIIYSKINRKCCINLTTRSQKQIERIEKIHNFLKDYNLSTKKIRLTGPRLLQEDKAEWRGDVEVLSKRWSTLTHNGPYFSHLMDEYKPMNASLIYDRKKYTLTPEEEKVLGFYAKRKITDDKGEVVEICTQDPVFNTNYFNDLKTYLTPEHRKIFVDFKKFDFSDIIEKMTKKIEDDKTLDKKRKLQITKKRDLDYGYGSVDNKTQKIGNFIIEPASIFYGRGKNPLRGRIKPDINPEEVTINFWSDKIPIPQPPFGHKWKEVVSDKESIWLAKWNDHITGEIKYVMFGAGIFKMENDLIKYEKARKLNKFIEKVREQYMRDVDSSDETRRQLGTVLYLIDNFGIRVGNEKEEDEADTVGVTTLRVEHIDISTKNHVIFNFIGKDSIQFYKDLIVSPLIYRNIVSFLGNKSPGDDLFDLVDSDKVNSYLKQFDKSFSAKVFRTRLASMIMYDELKKLRVPEEATKQQIKSIFNEANAKVANVLNHTRNVPKKRQEKIDKLKEELEKLMSEKKDKKKQEKIDKLSDEIKSLSDVIGFAMTTSLNNYIDPRLVVSWTTENKIPIDVIYSSALKKKICMGYRKYSRWLGLCCYPIARSKGITAC